MQHSSHTESKSSSLVRSSSQSFRWSWPWLPVDHDVRDVYDIQADYKRKIVRLMLAQACIFYGSSAIHFFPDDCQASFKFLPASRALSLAGILTQLAFYYGIPAQLPKALSFLRTEETRSRAIVFFASLWVPVLPFVLSIALLCFGANRGACIPVLSVS